MPKVNSNRISQHNENKDQGNERNYKSKVSAMDDMNSKYAYSIGKLSNTLGEIARGETAIFSEIKEKKYISDAIQIPLVKKGDNHLCNIAIVAPVSAGKSTLLNALCEYPILPVAKITTSSNPTYITRAKGMNDESVAVYDFVRKKYQSGNEETVRYERSKKGKVFYATDISKSLFDKLLDYAVFVMKGNGHEMFVTVENLVYFMRNPESVDTELDGVTEQKMNIPVGEFAFDYNNPRHRFVLLMVLLCLYVKQNEVASGLSPYKKELNRRRVELMRQLGIDVNKDYCVCLNWCSNSIPEGATLIDLPGTGSDTEDIGERAAHTVLVKGVLEESDALWVLCSDNGTTDPDLMEALKDDITLHPEKSKVCIYNCKNDAYNDASPVSDFIQKLRCLAGERCYVVDALAGEYKFTQNLVSVEKTRKANTLRKTMRQLGMPINDYRQCAEILANDYTQKLCPTYETIDRGSYIETVQNTDISYSLDSFFQSALADYVARLRFDVTAKESIDRLDFFGEVKLALQGTLELLESINGKGENISKAIVNALENCNTIMTENLTELMIQCQSDIQLKIEQTNRNAAQRINTYFSRNYKSLIQSIHSEWERLTAAGDAYCLKQSFPLKNYVLKGDNLTKFNSVRDIVKNKIQVNRFSDTLEEKNSIIDEYEVIFRGYIASLKNTAYQYMNDYLQQFSTEYDVQRDNLCCEVDENGNKTVNNKDLYEKFESVKSTLEPAIEKKMQSLHSVLCESFESILSDDSEFYTIVEETDKRFEILFKDIVLDQLREDINMRYNELRHSRFLLNDIIDVGTLHSILQDDFNGIEAKCEANIQRVVNGIYGDNYAGDEINFAIAVTAFANNTNSEQQKISLSEIRANHASIKDMVELSAGVVTNTDDAIADVKNKIEKWSKFENGYLLLGKELYEVTPEGFYIDYKKRLDTYKITP